MEIISKRIRKLHKSLGISHEKIGKILGAKQASINSYEHSKSAIPTKVLVRHAEFFDVLLDYIFGRIGNPRGMECKFNQNHLLKLQNKTKNSKILSKCVLSRELLQINDLRLYSSKF